MSPVLIFCGVCNKETTWGIWLGLNQIQIYCHLCRNGVGKTGRKNKPQVCSRCQQPGHNRLSIVCPKKERTLRITAQSIEDIIKWMRAQITDAS